jgi:ligand-binding sensor domain-containing protein
VVVLSKKLLLCFCLCFGFIEAAAQYRIDHWTADTGLPQNSVYGIVQTGDGYLWLATLDGLARFDGVRFTIFNKSNSAGIVNNRFVSLFETGAEICGREPKKAVLSVLAAGGLNLSARTRAFRPACIALKLVRGTAEL